MKNNRLIQGLEEEYEEFQNDFLKLLSDYKKKAKRLDKIIAQSDKQQFRFLQMNEELEDYKHKLEEKLKTEKIMFQKQRQAQMGEMISMIAHQWRQPLTTISNTIVGLQLKQMKLNFQCEHKKELEEFLEHQQKKFDRINEQVKLLSNTIDDFRNFFKPTKDKEEFPLTLPIDKAVSMIYSDLKQSHIDITKQYNCNETVFIHINEIVQVILNILKNSYDNFISKNIQNPHISIETSYDNNKNPQIIFKDNGGGIPEDILPKIFDPYFSTKDEKNGTGLGLYMSKMIIEEHNNGKLSCYNENDGVVFKISFKKITSSK